MNIAIISIWDYAGAGQHIANAVNKAGRHRATLIRQGCKPKTRAEGWQREVIRNADVIHIKGDEPLWKFNSIMAEAYGVECFSDFDVPLLISVEGGTFRKRVHPPDDYKETPLYALTPDLALPEYGAAYVPQAFNVEDYVNTWQRSDPPVIAHSPTNRAVKGTETIIEALAGYNLDIIEGVPLAECIERKAKATLFVDQCVCGCYAYAAIEAGAQGVPVAAYLLESQPPIVNCGQTPESIRAAVADALAGDMRELSRQTRQYMKLTHGYKPVGEIWSDIYEGLA
jgi:hypothetical protein